MKFFSIREAAGSHLHGRGPRLIKDNHSVKGGCFLQINVVVCVLHTGGQGVQIIWQVVLKCFQTTAYFIIAQERGNGPCD